MPQLIHFSSHQSGVYLAVAAAMDIATRRLIEIISSGDCCSGGGVVFYSSSSLYITRGFIADHYCCTDLRILPVLGIRRGDGGDGVCMFARSCRVSLVRLRMG